MKQKIEEELKVYQPKEEAPAEEEIVVEDTHEEEIIFTCENCGEEVKEDDIKCPKCGYLFENEETEDDYEIDNKENEEQEYNNINKKTSEEFTKYAQEFFPNTTRLHLSISKSNAKIWVKF